MNQTRRELQLLWKLALPTVIEQLLMTAVQYVDTAMVGRIGANASASVGITSTMVWLSNAPLYAIGVGVIATIARSSGAGNEKQVRLQGMQGVILMLLVGIVEGILMVSLSPFIPRWLGAEAAILPDACWYYGIISIPMVFRSAIIILGASLRGVKNSKGPMWINILMNVVNLALNLFLIYGKRVILIGDVSFEIWGAGLGVRGAAIATAVSFVVGGSMMIMLFTKNRELKFPLSDLHIDKRAMNLSIKISIPVALERMCVSLGHVVFTGFVTSLGTISLAAHSIALTAEQAFYIPGYGMQAAVSTLIGNALGEKSRDRVKRISRLTIGSAVLIMTISGMILFAFASFMMSVFTKDASVISMGTEVLRIVAISEPFFAVVIMMEGIFNGAGYTKVPFCISAFSMWAVRVLFTWICITFFDASLATVWMCMVADTLSRFICCLITYKRGKWVTL
ncbi:MAG: MATE family efflux transporter [Suipraeoptans sp.]